MTLSHAIAQLHELLYAKNLDGSYVLPDFDREALALAIDVLHGKWTAERVDEE